MHMKPVDIVIDKLILKCNYPKPALVSKNLPLNYLKSAYDLIKKHIAEGIIPPVDRPTEFCAKGKWGLFAHDN